MPLDARRGTGHDGRMRNDSRFSISVSAGRWLACAAALPWVWALALLSTREHLVDFYEVLASAPELWGFLVLPFWRICAILALGLLWVGAGMDRLGEARRLPAWSRWLLLAGGIPAFDLLRWAGYSIPSTFFEPLWLSFVTGMAASRWGGACWRWQGSQRMGFAVVLGLASAAAIWWYCEAAIAYRDFMLGYHDFGHFALRVINTWEGRGWLLETPSLPAFWDHFNPGLILLVPLWALWPDARLFLVVQALCLALPALFVYGIARRLQTPPALAAVWSAVYLAYPSVGLMNLCYSYGWHPVSMALPLLFLSVWFLLGGHRLAALLSLVVACSFKQTVIVIAGCLAAALALQRWGAARTAGGGDSRGVSVVPSDSRRLEPGSPRVVLGAEPLTSPCCPRSSAHPGVWGDTRLAWQLPRGGWLILWAALVVAFGAIVTWAPFTEFQTGRFSELGDSGLEILLSPVRRPGAFWGQVLRPASVYFLLALTVPWHLPTLFRGWPLLLATVLPLGILVAWPHGPAISIAFQYVTEMILVFFLAAVCGSGRVVTGASTPGGAAAPPGGAGARLAGGWPAAAAWGALGASLTASWLFGSLPWSGPTLTLMHAQTYPVPEGRLVANPRAAGTAGHALLTEMVGRVSDADAAVLATGRIAAHLLHVRRLESVEQALVRWEALADEAGPGRSPLHVFDWIVLDTYEHFQQSPERTERVLEEARRIGYEEIQNRQGLILLQRPGEERAD